MLSVYAVRQLCCRTVREANFSSLLQRNVFLYCCVMECVTVAK